MHMDGLSMVDLQLLIITRLRRQAWLGPHTSAFCKEMNNVFGSLQATTPTCSTRLELENEVTSKAHSPHFEKPY
jgi:hypothetical protein